MFDPDKDVWDLEQLDRNLDEQTLIFLNASTYCDQIIVFLTFVIFIIPAFAHPSANRNVTSLVDLSMDDMPGLRVTLNSETISMSCLSSLPSSSLNSNLSHQNPKKSPLEENNGQATLVLITILLATIFALYLCPQD